MSSIIEKRSKSLFIYNTKIERVNGFLYLGRWIQNNDDDTDCIDLQLKSTRKDGLEVLNYSRKLVPMLK